MKAENTKTQLTLRLPKDLNDLLSKLAEKTGIAKNALITTYLWEKVKEAK